MALGLLSSIHCNKCALHGRLTFSLSSPPSTCVAPSPWLILASPRHRQRPLIKYNKNSLIIRSQAQHNECIDEESSEEVQCVALTSVKTMYNDITILEAPQSMDSPYAGSRILLLDSSCNIHSIYRKEQKWTGSYWDEFASLPPIIPDGPVAIFGLGGGTAAHLMLDLWPSLRLEGWEIDEILVEKAREYLSLSLLEEQTTYGGRLQVHIGDALSSSATVPGGFAGIVVDLFNNGKILPQLQQAETWLELKKRLTLGGRIMVNCGGACVERRDPKEEIDDGTWTWEDGVAVKDATMEALSKAFPGHLSWRRMNTESDNYLALTGPFPDLQFWATIVPERLRFGVQSWKPF